VGPRCESEFVYEIFLHQFRLSPRSWHNRPNIMKPRCTWTGYLKISLVTVPVRVYTAISTTDKITFNQLHKGCHQRIRQKLVCPVHGKVERAVLDGELVVMDGDKPSLRAAQQRVLLQNRHRIRWLSRTNPVTYMAFDLPYLNGKPVFGEPLSFRRNALQQITEQFPLPGILVPEAVRHHGCQLFAEVARLGLEGVMAKRLDSPYLPGKRSHYWLKIKPQAVSGRLVRDLTTGRI
jgi:hypothetical protein